MCVGCLAQYPLQEVRQKLSGPYGTMLAWLKLDAFLSQV
ncbi:MAG: hypothetical protein CM1200mP12_16900 [Gammaproteobacteria bacterium]|nr:MAG: hypothetical protein CM1200mP12_16900 [Gammaproteobacteria bacterium]